MLCTSRQVSQIVLGEQTHLEPLQAAAVVSTPSQRLADLVLLKSLDARENNSVGIVKGLLPKEAA